jgi:hypothetical protein
MDGHAYDRHRSLFFAKGLTMATPSLNNSTIRGICQHDMLRGITAEKRSVTRTARINSIREFRALLWTTGRRVALSDDMLCDRRRARNATTPRTSSFSLYRKSDTVVASKQRLLLQRSALTLMSAGDPISDISAKHGNCTVGGSSPAFDSGDPRLIGLYFFPAGAGPRPSAGCEAI